MNLPNLIEDVGRYEFCVKPTAALALIHAGIPHNHGLFWHKKNASDVHKLFYGMTVTPTKVLSLVQCPNPNNKNESRVFGYLTTMIRNMKITELSHFLRFVTGASVCIVPKIRVELNGLEGFARRPIAHTCDSVLELPISYVNYDDVFTEFMLILNATNELCMAHGRYIASFTLYLLNFSFHIIDISFTLLLTILQFIFTLITVLHDQFSLYYISFTLDYYTSVLLYKKL